MTNYVFLTASEEVTDSTVFLILSQLILQRKHKRILQHGGRNSTEIAI